MRRFQLLESRLGKGLLAFFIAGGIGLGGGAVEHARHELREERENQRPLPPLGQDSITVIQWRSGARIGVVGKSECVAALAAEVWGEVRPTTLVRDDGFGSDKYIVRDVRTGNEVPLERVFRVPECD